MLTLCQAQLGARDRRQRRRHLEMLDGSARLASYVDSTHSDSECHTCSLGRELERELQLRGRGQSQSRARETL